MKNIRTTRSLWLCFLYLLCCSPYLSHAYSLRQFSNKNGLSNSAILSLYQDSRGLLWIGSCDGLNIFDGTGIHLYAPINSSEILLSGNLINQLVESGKDIVWIQTNYGLNRLDTKRQSSQSFTEFKGQYFMTKSKDNILFLLKDDGYLYYYREEAQAFRKLEIPGLDFSHVLSIAVGADDILWIFTSHEDTRSYQIQDTEQGIALLPNHLFKHAGQLYYAFAEEDVAYFIDETYALYEYDFRNRQSYYIADLKPQIEARGEVSSVIKQQNDYYVGFKNNGLIVLKYRADQKMKYQIQPTEIHSGIFCLVKDRFQHIVWVGTDGQGVYMYFNDTFSITNTLLDNPVYRISNPVRALYYDQERTLWIGTKGGGILRIRNYTPDNSRAASFELVSSNNSVLADNSVYCFAPGRQNNLWIGTENGINYYSYSHKQMRELPVLIEGEKVKYVHSIKQLNDTTLWLSTVGEGIVKVILNGSASFPAVKSASRTVIEKGRMASNYFYTSYQENDSILWFGNRGCGAYRMNVKTEKMLPYLFDDMANSQTANDIFAIYKNAKGYWLGTSSGLLCLEPGNFRQVKANLFSHNTVHGILEDRQGNLWMSTNQGLIRFNPDSRTGQTYNSESGLEITEFSDGAFYKDNATETLFFGGTNGFVAVRTNAYIAEEYMPQIHLKGLSIFGKEYNIYEFLHEQDNQTILQLDYSRNFFQIDFMAIDYIHGNNYSYSYKLKEMSTQWVACGTSASAIFSNLPPGEYTLLVKYVNNINGKESLIQSVLICITPPWYLGTWAYAGYFILFFLLCAAAIYRAVYAYRRKQRRMLEKINRQKKEEIYESKLRFFTNITHEFCTPLTLIYGPCEKILANPDIDACSQRYARMIQQNTEKLNNLILELLEFRRLETGNKVLSIQQLPVSEKTRNIAEAFEELAGNRAIDYRLRITPDIEWKTDMSCFNKIVNNLISNAFKYTPERGCITVELKMENRLLSLRVFNSGKGIARENLTRIFDRYKILDSVEMSGKNSRTGLGLAICKSMVTQLNGAISVDSVPDEMTTFTVTLPELPVTEQEAAQAAYETEPLHTGTEKPVELETTAREFDTGKQTIMVIDDDSSMLWFVSEIFADKYNVYSFTNVKEALANLESKPVDLIISDVMMPDIDGLSFARKIKQNKRWCHIPLVLLSALHHDDDRIKGIESGAEAYVAKPFNITYLERIVYRLIKWEVELKEYYSSVFSSFTIGNGNCLHKEEQEFLDKMLGIIEKNIANPDLQVELLSSEAGYSTRQFYRKLKRITEKSPASLIKEYRLVMAERLLVLKNFTIEEIMEQTGFNNRGTFYKQFSGRYGMPPKQYREQQKENVKKESSSVRCTEFQ
ncbi:MAG: response regulator [Parabacteroides sp.]|nr:response regulator [Parabacteroides sp.]